MSVSVTQTKRKGLCKVFSLALIDGIEFDTRVFNFRLSE